MKIVTSDEIRAIAGVDTRKCMRCGKCSASCPAYNEMDIRPHQFVSYVQNGEMCIRDRKKMDRVNTGILTSSIIGSVYSVVILGVMFLWSRQISLLFVDASETVILDQARQMLLINMVFYIPLTLVNVVRFTVQGMGFSKFAILAGVCEMIGRSVVAFFLVPYFGYTAVCFASPVAWILADLFLVPAYLYLSLIHI